LNWLLHETGVLLLVLLLLLLLTEPACCCGHSSHGSGSSSGGLHTRAAALWTPAAVAAATGFWAHGGAASLRVLRGLLRLVLLHLRLLLPQLLLQLLCRWLLWLLRWRVACNRLLVCTVLVWRGAAHAWHLQERPQLHARDWLVRGIPQDNCRCWWVVEAGLRCHVHQGQVHCAGCQHRVVIGVQEEDAGRHLLSQVECVCIVQEALLASPDHDNVWRAVNRIV
jgi:hypothetical protein